MKIPKRYFQIVFSVENPFEKNFAESYCFFFIFSFTLNVSLAKFEKASRLKRCFGIFSKLLLMNAFNLPFECHCNGF